MVEYIDKLMGRVIDKLDELVLRENTLVIFTSDNGTEQGVTSIVNGEEFVGGKLTSTDAGTRVPLIANWPGVIPEGVVNDDLVCFTYFFPTLAEVAGIYRGAKFSLFEGGIRVPAAISWPAGIKSGQVREAIIYLLA